jgi:hypothetical protein
MGGVIEIFFWMLVIACVAFAPLGYFIYMYIAKNGEPFGDTEPHGDSDSLVLQWAERLVEMAKVKFSKIAKAK